MVRFKQLMFGTRIVTFDCSDCHLAWLIRDNRKLLPSVEQGTCSNGTTFDQLDPNGFAECPVIKITT